jgi:hypothetical protein
MRRGKMRQWHLGAGTGRAEFEQSTLCVDIGKGDSLQQNRGDIMLDDHFGKGAS